MKVLAQRTVRLIFALVVLSCVVLHSNPAQAWSSLAVSDDPLLRMPGTQPGQVQLEEPSQCFNCHGDFNPATEPGAWKGSMMAQAARDPIFWAATTVAAQDSIWAIGRPNATDLCLRCHFPQGWLEERSDPTNASLMQGADFDGVHCGLCHRLVDPFFESTFNGTREGSDWLEYWDETNLSSTTSSQAAQKTHDLDEAESSAFLLFNGSAFLDAQTNQPHSADWVENASGQYFLGADAVRRGPFADADAAHDVIYSRYHKSRYFCSTCHDVSNPVLANLSHGDTVPGDGTTVLPSEQLPAFSYGHVERTFSEFMLSDFGQAGGAPGSGVFAPEVFTTSLENNYIARCQDCHMPDTRGRAAKQPQKAILRPDGSVEHPKSGVPSHDLTGGNVWIPRLLASTVAGSPNFNARNLAILGQGAEVLTLDLNAGLGLDAASLLAAADRALANLQRAATIEQLHYDQQTQILSFRVLNHTGHKLLSGFPEGRRIWVNIRAYDAEETLLAEINPYDAEAATLKGLLYSYHDPAGVLPAPLPLLGSESHVDSLVYEMSPSSSLTGEAHTFHFVLADNRYKDNRIPPRGFRVGEAMDRLAEPAWSGNSAPDYFTAEEYLGGYDEIQVPVSQQAHEVEVRLYYQTTSREYMEFLRNEINGDADSLPGNGVAGDAPYLAQTDPFFDALKAWGDAIWQLWRDNRSMPGADPILMAEASFELPAIPEASVDIEKATNGQDADIEPGPLLRVGEAVTWTYEVTNTSNVTLTGIAVTDDQGVTVDCPGTTLVSDASMTCSASGTVAAGQYTNLGSVTAQPPVGPPVTDSDPSHYFGIDEMIFEDGFE